MKRSDLTMVAPYIAVLIFWVGFKNGWLAMLCYHLLIVLCSHRQFRELRKGWNLNSFMMFALPAALAGGILFWGWPFLFSAELMGNWLNEHAIYRSQGLLLLLWFGLLHPPLEQMHWNQHFQARGWIAYAAFGGYHVIVLLSLLPWYLLCAIFFLLSIVACVWRKIAENNHGLIVTSFSHIFADFGIAVAALALLSP